MVSTQDTQPAHSPSPRQGDDSVRITAQQRRQVLRDHLTDELARAQTIAAAEANDLKVLRSNGLPCAQAELRAANATALVQYLGSTLRSYSDNRDFLAVKV